MAEASSEQKLHGAKFCTFIAALAVFAYLGWSWWSTVYNLFWTVLPFIGHLTGPTLLFIGLTKIIGGQAKAEAAKSKAEREPGLLSFIPDLRVRWFCAMIVLPGLGFFNWNLQKYTYATMGAATNATIAAGMSSKDFVKSVASFVLLPMVSMVSAAHQANDHTRLLQIVGTGLGISLLSGIVAQTFIFTQAQTLMGLFEGAQPLLPEAPTLLKTYSLAFVCTVLNETMIAVLAGTHAYLSIGECVLPVVAVSLTNSLAFYTGRIELASMLTVMSMSEIFFSCVLAWTVSAAIQRARRGRLQAALAKREEAKDGEAKSQDAKAEALLALAGEPRPGLLPLILDLEPTREVFKEMVSASGNTSVRNFALRMKPFFSGMFATRMGTVHGSTFSIQMTLTAYLSGPAGSSGLFTANAAPTLLQTKCYGVFIFGVKVCLVMLCIVSGAWFVVAASGGPARVLRFGGVLPSADSIGGASAAALSWNQSNATSTGANWSFASNLSTAAAAADASLSIQRHGDAEEYLQVLTPLNHWLWACGTLANEIAAPFDGILMVLNSYSFIGKLYALDFLMVLMPALYAANQAGKDGSCVLPGPLSSLGGCNSYTGVQIAGLLWGIVRLVGLLWAVFWHELPKLRRQRDSLSEACTPAVIRGYIEHRLKVSDEEVEALKDKHRQNKLYGFSVDTPVNKWAEAHNTSAEAMSWMVKDLMSGSDPKFVEESQPFWDRYGGWM